MRHPVRVVTGGKTALPRPEGAKQLIDDVVAAGGSLAAQSGRCQLDHLTVAHSLARCVQKRVQVRFLPFHCPKKAPFPGRRRPRIHLCVGNLNSAIADRAYGTGGRERAR
jgi:hypothetical protein